MSKQGSRLVSYASSDEGVEAKLEGPPKKKSFHSPLTQPRKLPPLSSKLVVATPANNPALHQGRVRNSPHVDGRWACHVFVPVVSETDEQLGRVLSSAFQGAKAKVPTLRPIGLDDGRWELHISLSRPTFLWTHQREEFKNAVRRVAAAHQGWTLSLVKFIKLENDDHSRVFLAVQVGAGHEQIGALTDALTPALRAIKQSEFYPEPKFHVSIGWALLERNGIDKSTEDFPTITELPQDVIEDLNRDFAPQLCRPSARVEVEEVCVKIGKDVFRWGLG
ncbi:hypothetical protein BDM02DRAFT_3154187 [Thelephora ganbajun]|uniref:Uncharacterized protein n=1 Tax=Thelephora ganbajun TaxID=370292 RepID=A0ACB6ZP31_THEGA|nr:hypothetical protein BDM02DRAFT_3154187 [Thelephora ganbajun]